MRHSSLCVVLVGALPLASFAATVWLTDGAPFRPYDVRFYDAGLYGAGLYGSVAPLRDAAAVPPAPEQPMPVSPMPALPDTRAAAAGSSGGIPRTDTGDPEWDRLRRLAGRGDAEAALLLAILEPPRRREIRALHPDVPAKVPAAVVGAVPDP